jgi:hypothetical protein
MKSNLYLVGDISMSFFCIAFFYSLGGSSMSSKYNNKYSVDGSAKIICSLNMKLWIKCSFTIK